ncbi:cell division protein ZipA [Amphritea sp.]|uniref:cell division protein ZipA n=1 Tax=Amphritea sp. TaxID=1872502 RepID=UPI0025B9FF6E|nr:cell division protein ZipA [Amphritea sp.]
MELGLREWLIIGGAIVVLLIVLDGWRRMRGGGNNLKMNIDSSLSELPDIPDESFNPELPGGGARVIGRDGYAESKPVAAGTNIPEKRQEPVFGNDELDLSSARATLSEKKPQRNFDKPSAKKLKNTSYQPVTQDEHDPLFASSDSFPPHSDGPSFDELAEGISAVRVIPASEPESEFSEEDEIPVVEARLIQPEPEPEPEPELIVESDASENKDLFADVEEQIDQPVKDLIDEQEQAEELTVGRIEEQVEEPVAADLFMQEDPIDEKADELEYRRKRAAYSADEDDLIASLPDGFRLDARSEGAVDEEEHDFDLTRPVSELVRPAKDEDSQPEQAAMDLPEQQASIFTLVNDSESEPEASKLNFTATDDKRIIPDEGLFTDEPKPVADHSAKTKSHVETQQKNASMIEMKGQSLQKIPEADKVLVISVASPDGGESFSGQNLLQIVLACGMRYGDMKIFHRYEDGIDKGAIQFSMTNALEPGYFDIDTMDSIETRGVTFFMSMEEPRDVMNAYECMLATADAVAKNLHGVLLDENRSTMRDQTKEHYRERVRRYEMRKLKKTTTA